MLAVPWELGQVPAVPAHVLALHIGTLAAPQAWCMPPRFCMPRPELHEPRAPRRPRPLPRVLLPLLPRVPAVQWELRKVPAA